MPLDVVVLIGAIVLDMTMPEPPARLHPVVWMGKVIGLADRMVLPWPNRRQLVAGLAVAILVPATFGLLAWLVSEGLRGVGPVAYVIGGAILLRTTFTVTGLTRAARRTAAALEAGDLPRARRTLRDLVSRPTEDLDQPLIAEAAIASVAENTTDSVIGPWLAFGLFGLPGAVAYRAVNTLDSMVGYHGRHEYVGKASARSDDLINLVPARLAAVLLVVAGAIRGGDARAAWNCVRRERNRVASPNGGWTMGAMAGSLGVVLEKHGHYRLGEGGRAPGSSDIWTSTDIAVAAAAIGAVVTVLLILAAWSILG